METTLNSAILIGLATFAVTYLLRHTMGPFDIFSKFRILVGIHLVERHDGDGIICEEEYVEDKFFAKLVSCVWCLSTWVVLALTLLTRASWLAGLAALAIAGLLHEWLEAQ